MRSAGCPCRDRSPTRHVPSRWDSLVDLLQHFNYSGNFPHLWNCFLSVKSHNKGHKLGFGVLFHLHWAPAFDFGVFLPFLIFSSHIAFARTPPKIKFLILWAAANGVHRKFTRKIWYFFWYFLSSSEYRAKKQAWRVPWQRGSRGVRTCLPHWRVWLYVSPRSRLWNCFRPPPSVPCDDCGVPGVLGDCAVAAVGVARVSGVGLLCRHPSLIE